VVPRPEHSLTELEAQTDSVLERLSRDGPAADEMARARAGLEFQFVSSLESGLGKAEILTSGLVFHGDPTYFRTRYGRLRAVSAADVQRVARTYLGAHRVALSVVPQGKPDQASKPESSTRVTVGADGGHYIMESR
jgi:zinc protease